MRKTPRVVQEEEITSEKKEDATGRMACGYCVLTSIVTLRWNKVQQSCIDQNLY